MCERQNLKGTSGSCFTESPNYSVRWHHSSFQCWSVLPVSEWPSPEISWKRLNMWKRLDNTTKLKRFRLLYSFTYPSTNQQLSAVLALIVYATPLTPDHCTRLSFRTIGLSQLNLVKFSCLPKVSDTSRPSLYRFLSNFHLKQNVPRLQEMLY